MRDSASMTPLFIKHTTIYLIRVSLKTASKTAKLISSRAIPLIARFMGPTWGPSGSGWTKVDPMLAPWTLLSGMIPDSCTHISYCPACRTSLIATRFWVVMICPIIKCLTVLEFSFILFDLCLFITIFNFILNYVPIVTFWILTYHRIWILLIIFCFIWSYWIIYF